MNQQWDFDLQDDHIWIIRSHGSSDMKALSVENNSKANGARIIQWWYQPTNQFEQWRRTSISGSERFVNVGTNKCLAVEGGTAGTLPAGSQVILYDCGLGPDQQWNANFI